MKCLCGCGEETNKGKRFIYTHHNRGKTNPNYGKVSVTRGMKRPDVTKLNRVRNKINNPMKSISARLKVSKANRKPGTKGYVLFLGRHHHRTVAEQKLGRKLKPLEIVHHKDGNKQNNTPENLEIITQSQHVNIHRKDMLHRKGGDANAMSRR